MNVLRLHAAGDLRFHEEEKPVPQPGESLIRIGAVGICGSDLHWFDEGGIGDAGLDRPLTLGHEMAGWTEDGQLVAIDPNIPCGVCEYCQEGSPNLCTNHHFAGHGHDDGSLREYMVWPDHCLFPLPEGFTPTDGAMLEPLGVALYSVDLSGIRPGDTVGIFGCGPIGLMIVQLARVAGASHIIATDLLPHRVEAAQASGADLAFLAEAGREVEQIRSALNGKPVDVVIEAAGTNAAIETALQLVKPGGKVTLVGIPSEDETRITASLVRRKGLALQWVRRMKHTYPRTIELVRRGQVDMRALISHTFPFEQADQAFRSAQSREGLKVVVTMDKK